MSNRVSDASSQKILEFLEDGNFLPDKLYNVQGFQWLNTETAWSSNFISRLYTYNTYIQCRRWLGFINTSIFLTHAVMYCQILTLLVVIPFTNITEITSYTYTSGAWFVKFLTVLCAPCAFTMPIYMYIFDGKTPGAIFHCLLK